MIQVFKNTAIALLCATAMIFVGVCLLIVLSVPGQRRRDRDYERKLQPSIAFVESFEAKNRRLPSDEEFDARPGAAREQMIDLIQANSADAAFKAHGGGKSKSDFAVRVWRGEQWTYYFSWSREFEIVEPDF